MEQEIKENSMEEKKAAFRGFYGNHHHTLDAKNRAFVPAKFKDGLDSVFMLTKGIEKCLVGYQVAEWEKYVEHLKQIPFTDRDGRNFVRLFAGNAIDCEVDKQGRFSIPQSLREYGQLTKEICFVGLMDHFEIWDSAVWAEVSGRLDYDADIQAEKMQKYLKPSLESSAV